MNILYLAQYRGPNDGWSTASRKYLDSLLLTSHNIACKSVYMAGQGGKVSQKVEKAEKNVLDKIDVCIQHVLPDLLEWNDCYNIGLFFTETRHLEKIGWVEKINLLDEVWVNSPAEKQNLINSGVKCKINIVPIPFKPLPESEPFYLQEIDGKFTFYFIGEHSDRKNIMALVKAFQREFTPGEDVALLIKTNTDQLLKDINEWHQTSRLKKEYIPEVVIHGDLPDSEIAAIHKACDVFICPSRGESVCMPILDALYYNKPVVCSKHLFISSLLKDQIIGVESQETPVDTKSPPLPHIYTGNETWEEINIIELQEIMRSLHSSGGIIIETQDYVLNNFSYEVIAKKMEEYLNNVNNL